jgi:hypothetical protein
LKILPITLGNYQEDFTTPGISPFNAKLRKQSRQMPNFRRNARGRPHKLQRLCCRDENFGLRLSFTLFAVVAIDPLLILSPSSGSSPKAPGNLPCFQAVCLKAF